MPEVGGFVPEQVQNRFGRKGFGGGRRPRFECLVEHHCRCLQGGFHIWCGSRRSGVFAQKLIRPRPAGPRGFTERARGTPRTDCMPTGKEMRSYLVSKNGQRLPQTHEVAGCDRLDLAGTSLSSDRSGSTRPRIRGRVPWDRFHEPRQFNALQPEFSARFPASFAVLVSSSGTGAARRSPPARPSKSPALPHRRSQPDKPHRLFGCRVRGASR